MRLGALMLALAAVAVAVPSGAAARRLRHLRGLPSALERMRRATAGRVRLIDLTARPAFVGAGLAAGALAGLMYGWVAAVLAGVYVSLAVRAYGRSRVAVGARRERVMALDAVAALAADVRAGGNVHHAFGAAAPALAPWHTTGAEPAASLADGPATDSRAPACRCVLVALRLVDRTGAPLADVLDRAVADLRARDSARDTSAAHTAGARATACLLALLPLAGVLLGVALGVDPLRVLFQTPAGAVCAAVALVLQLSGFALTARLARSGAVA